MFTVKIYELESNRVMVDFPMPADVQGVAKGSHIAFNAALPKLALVPIRGRVSVRGSSVVNFGDTLQVMTGIAENIHFEYKTCIPTVRSKSMDALGVNGLYRPILPADLESDFKGFSDLPSEKWVQLNASTSRLVVQLKIQKTVPSDDARDPTTGEYYVYVASRVVVSVAATAPSDTEKALKV